MFPVVHQAQVNTRRLGLNVAGFTTVESLVALVMFAVGVLGSVGTVALAVRAMRAAASAAAAARLLPAIADSLAGAVVAGSGYCGVLSAGNASGSHGLSAAWRVAPVPGGREIELAVTAPALRGPRTDSVRVLVPCR